MKNISNKIKNIITNMTIDSGLVIKEAESLESDIIFISRINKILNYNMSLFNNIVYNEKSYIFYHNQIIKLDDRYIKLSMIVILNEILKYSIMYNKSSYKYRVFNSLYDIVLESLNELEN